MLGSDEGKRQHESGINSSTPVQKRGQTVRRVSALLLAAGALYSSASAQVVEDASLVSRAAAVTIYNSEIGALRTLDGGKTWQVMSSESAERLQNRLARKLSARHQGADVRSSGRTEAYPNPAANSVSIRYELSAPGEVNVAFHDLHGREVLRAFEGPRAAGEHSLSLDTRSLTEGVYQYRIVSSGAIIAGSTMVVTR
jgi:hypothetical protein